MVFGKRFNAEKKLKPLLETAASRFHMESNAKSIAAKQKMRLVAEYLAENPQKEEKARIRAEALIRDENLIEAYEILQSDCELLADRIQLIQNSKKVCPPDILLCVSRLLYASNRVGSIAELKEIYGQLEAKYGEKFITKTEANLRNDRIVSKLSVLPQEPNLVTTFLKSLCEECNVNRIPGKNEFSRQQTMIEPTVYNPAGFPIQAKGQRDMIKHRSSNTHTTWGNHSNPHVSSCSILMQTYSTPIESVRSYPATSEYNTINVAENLPMPSHNANVDMTKPVKVFILLGQSNMIGYGEISGNTEGYLDYTVQHKKRFTHLMDNQGNWTQRKNVRNLFFMNGVQHNDPLKVGSAQRFGVEMQFGSILGELYDGPILLLKTCIGNRSMGWDLLPPTATERYEYGDKTYAAYRDRTSSWDIGTEPVPGQWYAGKQYDIDFNSIKHVLSNIKSYYDGAQSYEIAGFVFWQGHKDGLNRGHAAQYETNFVQYIQSLRNDLKAPEAKFVCATVAHEGYDMKGSPLTIANAQLAINDNEEFEGNAKTVDVRSSWRNSGPKSAGPHYNHHAETYMEVGDALGWGMVDLLMNHQKSPNVVIPGTEQWNIRPVMGNLPVFLPPSSYVELEEIPRPSRELQVDMKRSVKVFILLGGDTFMANKGPVTGDKDGSLEYALEEKMRFSHLMEDDGSFTVRRNVRYIGTDGRRNIGINQLLSLENLQKIGCEIQFGSVIGEKMKDEPVLIIKSILGGRSLGYDFTTPDRERFTDDNNKIYPGYKDNFLPYEDGTAPKVINGYAGQGYDRDVAKVKHILNNLADYYPGATSYEIMGFTWWQGRGDDLYLDRYETNLKQLIDHLRYDFDAPDAKFVCATAGYAKKNR